MCFSSTLFSVAPAGPGILRGHRTNFSFRTSPHRPTRTLSRTKGGPDFMFIDFVIHICDRIMRQTPQQNVNTPSVTNLPTTTQETIRKPHTDTNCDMPTILLVEKEPALLDSFRDVLEQSGYNVLTADSGESAIGICRKHIGKIDLLVSDVVMDRVTGFEVAANVKA